MPKKALPSDEEVDAYIRQRASGLGIDPETAVKVSRAERGSRSGGWLGDFVDKKATSFGPYQLHYGGGLGDVFTSRTGMSAQDSADNWQAQVDFSLQWVKEHGWGDFHAAARQGIGIWDGIKRGIGSITSAFKYFFPVVGYNGNPKATYHTPGATDLFAPEGTPVRSVTDGRVMSAGWDKYGGNTVTVRGEDGLTYYYAHLQEAANVKAGDMLAAGQRFAKVGNTGDASHTQPHLHIGIGYGITDGTGANGGAGERFDAQSFLAQILSRGGNGDDPVGLTTDAVGQVAGMDIGGGIRGAIASLWEDAHQGLLNYVEDRTATIILLGAGIFLILAGLWGLATQSKLGRAIVKTGAGAVGGPVGSVAAAAI